MSATENTEIAEWTEKIIIIWVTCQFIHSSRSLFVILTVADNLKPLT